MFKILQKNNSFLISLAEFENRIYENLLLKYGENSIALPIISNEIVLEESTFRNWIDQFEFKNAILALEYLVRLEQREEQAHLEEQEQREEQEHPEEQEQSEEQEHPELDELDENPNLVMVNGVPYERRRCLFKPHKMRLEVENIHTFQIDDITVYPHFNKSGYFIFAFNKNMRQRDYYVNKKLSKIKITNKQFLVRGNLTVRNMPLSKVCLEIQSRGDSGSTFAEAKMTLLKKKKTKTGYHYLYEFEVEASEAVQQLVSAIENQFDEDVWDVWWSLTQEGITDQVRIRCGMPRVIVEQRMNGEISLDRNELIHNLVPYFTVKGRNLSFFYNQYSKDEFKTYQQVLKKGKLKVNNSDKPIWIIGERPYKAQDNGLRFFEYLRTNRPEIDAYYVIRKDSPERVNVESLGNILDYRSSEHFELMVKADYICGTHHPDFLYPNRSKKFTKCLHAKQVFLQHGVLGVKNISGFYSKKMNDFNTDLFITSSEREKNIVLHDMDYEDYEVAVTGLPRFARLFANDTEVKKQVLIIPTWRDWLTTSDKFLKSEYFIRYTELINNPKLLALKDEGVELLFCLHPNMQVFTDLFEIPEQFTVIHQGDRLVQDLLKESALLITDYSSVAFDFSFLHKPVIYYQFDRKRFLGKYPSHLDIDATLPGVITADGDEVVHEIWNSFENQFQMTDHYKHLADEFIKDRDTNSNDRIFEAITKIPVKVPMYDKLKNHQIYNAAMKKFRKNKRYFPIMKKAYKVMSKTVKKNPKLILFESGVGKQISDSPKVIYDELLRRNADYEYIWVYNGRDEIKKSHTKVVRRLSPAYYYYLAKSKYWINNQNFPNYLKTNSSQTYIQTWHGTPLKKMQNDVEHFEGKDAGYLDRVNNAVKQWDYLVSPSPYATKAFRSAFQFKKEVLEVGYPRNDIFYHEDEQQQYIDQVRSKYNIPKDKKVLLYAPTFRDDDVNEKRKHLFTLQLDLEKLYQHFGEEYVILIRTHVIIGNKLTIPEEYRDFAINVSKYHDIQHLYLIADVCMTDYSSVMFDFAHTKRPLLFFTYDLEHYKEHLRGFYMDFEKEAPGPLLMNNDELVDALANLDQMTETYKDKYVAFHNKYCGLEDGTAAKQIVDKFFK